METKLQPLSSTPSSLDKKVQAFIFFLAALCWGVFLSSSLKFSGWSWFGLLFGSRLLLLILALVLAWVSIVRPGKNLLSAYFILCLMIQSIFGFLEPSNQIEFYQYCGYFLFLSAFTYSGSLRDWIFKHFLVALAGLVFPLMSKDEIFFGSFRDVVFNFTTTFALIFMSIATVRSSSRRYFQLLENIDLKDRIISLESSRRAEIDREVEILRAQIERASKVEAYSIVAQQVYHDIHSPLRALHVVSSSISGISLDAQAIISSAVQRINEIVNDLGLRGGIDGNGSLIRDHQSKNLEMIEVCDLLKSVISEKKIEFQSAHRIDIQFLLDNRLLHAKVWGDAAVFKRMISNLINNAVEAIGASGTIKVSVREESGSLYIQVIDSGKGIPAEVLSKIMTKGFSFEKPNGSGLGLFSAKNAVEAWNGSIAIESRCGVGTTVGIRLPLAALS